MNRLLPLLLALAASGCGYHVVGHSDLLPKEIKTIAIPPFGNATVIPSLSRLVTGDLTREFISRTRYRVVVDATQADAVLQGAVVNYNNYPIVSDPASGRATGVQVRVVLQVTLTDRHSGKVLFSRPGLEVLERYEVALDPQGYFDESGTGIQRLSRDVARSVASAILAGF